MSRRAHRNPRKNLIFLSFSVCCHFCVAQTLFFLSPIRVYHCGFVFVGEGGSGTHSVGFQLRLCPCLTILYDPVNTGGTAGHPLQGLLDEGVCVCVLAFVFRGFLRVVMRERIQANSSTKKTSNFCFSSVNIQF